jgi:hypothetical protein
MCTCPADSVRFALRAPERRDERTFLAIYPLFTRVDQAG